MYPSGLKKLIGTLLIILGVVHGQYQQYLSAYDFLSNPPTFSGHAGPGIVAQDNRGQPHPAVVENSIREAQLPEELLNEFYKNPRIAAGLARESWFGDKEFPVHNREADKISRLEIAKIVRRIQHKDR